MLSSFHRPRAMLRGPLVIWSRLRRLAIRCVVLQAALLSATAVIAQQHGAAEAQRPAHEPSGLEVASAMEGVVVDAIARNEASVVAIGLFREGGASGFESGPHRSPPSLDDIPDTYGTGVVIDRNGLILTNFHVLHKDMLIYVRVAGKPIWCSARIKAADDQIDLAVLEIVDPQPRTLELRPIVYGDASHLKRGQIVITLGNPYAIARDGQASAAWGIVSNLGRSAPPVQDATGPDQHPTLHHYGTLIQTDAKLNIGTSGGPLLNLKGEMIGLTTAMAALSGYEKSAGFAIPVDDTFRRAVGNLVEGRAVEYGFLGVQPVDLATVELADGQRGVRIMRVVSGTPAAGVLQERDIVTHVNDEALQSVNDMMLAIGKRAPGEQVRLSVIRDGQSLSLSATLTKNTIRGSSVVTNPRPAWRGLRVEYPSALRSRYVPDAIPSNCVVVQEVETGSPAAAQNMHPGMQISQVEDVAVKTPDEFLAATAGRKGPVRLSLTGPDAQPNGDPTVLVIPPAGK